MAINTGRIYNILKSYTKEPKLSPFDLNLFYSFYS